MSGRMRRIRNQFVAALLRSPIHRALSGSLILISYRGRKSGRESLFLSPMPSTVKA
jgi:hypothetical protein